MGNENSVWNVLVVDDEPDMLAVTRMALEDFEFLGRRVVVHDAKSTEECKKRLDEVPEIAVAFLDIVMEEDDSGFQLIRHIREDRANKIIRLIIRTGQPGKAPLLEVVGKYDINDYKEKTELTIDKLRVTLMTALRSWNQMKEIEQLQRESEETQREIILNLGELMEARSGETVYHVHRVAAITKLLAEHWGMPSGDLDLLALAAAFHDVGKIVIPEAILNKPGPLTPDEFLLIKEHARIGRTILSKSTRPLFRVAAVMAGQHHERYDGTGYPDALKGENIHPYGRILALADVYDALSHDRVYKKAWPQEQVLAYIREQSGRHFDPELVDLFFRLYDRIQDVIIQDWNAATR